MSRLEVKYFKLPKGFSAHTQSKWSYITFSKDYSLSFKLIPLRPLKSALDLDSYPTKEMVKILRKGKKVPPITVEQRKNGKYIILDGNTRVSALQLMNANGKIPAIIAKLLT